MGFGVQPWRRWGGAGGAGGVLLKIDRAACRYVYAFVKSRRGKLGKICLKLLGEIRQGFLNLNDQSFLTF